MTESDATRNYYAPLTGLRAVAAASVVFFHYFLTANVFQYAELPFASWMLANGQTGVTLFFALSGFLITLRYRDKLSRKAISLKEYWLRRFARIYPVYFVTLTFLALAPALLAGGKDYTSPAIFVGLYALAQGLFRPLFGLGIPIGWSLTVEEIFYLLAPRIGGFLDPRPLAGIAAIAARGALLSLLAGGLFVASYVSGIGQSLSGYNDEMLFGVSFLIRAPDFIVGMVAALIMLRHREWAAQRAVALTWWGVVGSVAFMLLGNELFHQGLFAANALARTVSAGFCAAMMLGLTLAPTRTALARALGHPVLDYLGKTSYSLYLVHLTAPMQGLWAQLIQLPVSPLAAVPVMYLAAVAASILLFELIEQPAHDWLSRRIGRG